MAHACLAPPAAAARCRGVVAQPVAQAWISRVKRGFAWVASGALRKADLGHSVQGQVPMLTLSGWGQPPTTQDMCLRQRCREPRGGEVELLSWALPRGFRTPRGWEGQG